MKQLELQPSYIDIPAPVSMEGWKGVEIRESSQPLILLNDLDQSLRVRLSPQYFLLGIPHASDKVYVRQETAERLISAASKMPERLFIVVFDAYRPVVVQQEIFRDFMEKLRIVNPEIDEENLVKMTERYVSHPSIDPKKPSPHSTGGAIDLSIVEEDGSLIEMGSDWDSFNVRSQTPFFRDTHILYHQNRRFLYNIMIDSGFTNYPEEWWHFDFGNQFWGFLSGQKAIYGIANEGGEIDGNKS